MATFQGGGSNSTLGNPSVEIEVTTNVSTITQVGSELHAAVSNEYQWGRL